MKTTLLMSILMFTLTFAHNAHAYLDPGSGSFMLQILLGTFVAGFFAVKQYWHRLKGYFKKRSRNKEDQEHE